MKLEGFSFFHRKSRIIVLRQSLIARLFSSCNITPVFVLSCVWIVHLVRNPDSHPPERIFAQFQFQYKIFQVFSLRIPETDLNKSIPECHVCQCKFAKISRWSFHLSILLLSLTEISRFYLQLPARQFFKFDFLPGPRNLIVVPDPAALAVVMVSMRF